MTTPNKKRFNWLDMLVYRLYYWRWRPIYERDLAVAKFHAGFMQKWIDAHDKPKGKK